MVKYLVFLYSLMLLLPLAAQAVDNGVEQCPVMKVEAERLADLNLPRHGHSILLVNGEPTVIAGHTTNFVPTPTLEYYKDGAWHLVQTAFTHDDGCAVKLTTGKVLIAGGHKENMGIGQSFEAELYDPVTHTCQGFASLDIKRAKPSVLALDSGRAVIAGNWYHKDAIEMYDGKECFTLVKGVSIGRTTPHILRTAKDDAIIIGGADTIGHQITLPVVDRLQGEPYHVPLLETWRLFRGDKFWPSSHCFIGDEAKGDYSYLLPIKDDEGHIAIARVTNGEFSLLPTDVSIPKSCQWGEIFYGIGFLVDRLRQRAYLLGSDAGFVATSCDTTRVYVIAIDYAQAPARLTLCYTDVLIDVDVLNPLLTDDGNLMLIGGVPTISNFKPTAATWLIHVNPNVQKAATGLPLWGWLLIVLTPAVLASWLMLQHRRKKRPGEVLDMVPEEDGMTVTDIPEKETQEALESSEGVDELMQRLCRLMEEQRPFLNPNLKMTDVANALGTNRNVLSYCINSQRGCTFPQFVNVYRVKFAQQMLSSQPDTKLTEVWTAAGFSSESTFYRIFKSITGVTPNDWKNNGSS